MNILFICHRFPYPPKRGGKIRPFHIIKHLSASHRVTVASLARSPEEAREAEGIAPFCAAYELARVSNNIQSLRMVARLPTMQPSSMGYFYSPALAQRVNRLLESQHFDLIFVHCSSVAQYVENAKGTAKLLDFGDMDSQKWLEYAGYKPFPLSAGYRLEGDKMRRAEIRLSRKFDLCTVTTRAELDTLNSYGSDVQTDWFPNGVDGDYFSPTDDDAYDPDTMCFLGRMDYYPNQQCMFEFCAKVLPELRARRPSVKLQIVGADPSPAVQRLGQLAGVTVTGSVSDVRPYLRRSALSIAPLIIARGTQNKILEAMATGVPVVTSKVAAGGVDALVGEHLLVAETTGDYVQAILRILDSPAERQRLARAGRERMQSHHHWDRSMEKLDTIIARCMTLATSSSRKSRVRRSS